MRCINFNVEIINTYKKIPTKSRDLYTIYLQIIRKDIRKFLILLLKDFLLG